MEWLTWITTYTLIILAELGDKTQVATLILASNNPGKRWVIFGGAAAALSLCVLLEVTIGTTISQFLSQATINKFAGVTFLVIGVVTLFRQYAGSKGWQLLGDCPKVGKEKEIITSGKL